MPCNEILVFKGHGCVDMVSRLAVMRRLKTLNCGVNEVETGSQAESSGYQGNDPGRWEGGKEPLGTVLPMGRLKHKSHKSAKEATVG